MGRGMNEYTPEKVAELIAEARAFVNVTDDGFYENHLVRALADALTAVSADRDRLRKAITEALAVRLDRNLPLHRAWPRYQDDIERILRAALDKEGNDDE
jgi:DNA/RNA-binding domain of Phe-tRNA-synthetase-like protein